MKANRSAPVTILLVYLLCAGPAASAFVYPPTCGERSLSFSPELPVQSTTALSDGSIIEQLASFTPAAAAAAAGLAGSATGWLSRGAEVDKLKQEKKVVEKELDSSNKAFDEAKNELDEKIDGYDRALFEMDQEYEGQTAEIRTEYEAKLERTKGVFEENYKRRLDVAKRTMRGEMELELIEQKGKSRQDFLQEKLELEDGFSEKSQQDVLRSLGVQSQLVSENRDLKDSLEKVTANLKELMRMRGGM